MDGTETTGLEEASRNAFSNASDSWASAEYRQKVAPILAKRCLTTINLTNP
jgi:CO/xanthine dehydrogenase FAD-binding subunit